MAVSAAEVLERAGHGASPTATHVASSCRRAAAVERRADRATGPGNRAAAGGDTRCCGRSAPARSGPPAVRADAAGGRAGVPGARRAAEGRASVDREAGSARSCRRRRRAAARRPLEAEVLDDPAAGRRLPLGRRDSAVARASSRIAAAIAAGSRETIVQASSLSPRKRWPGRSLATTGTPLASASTIENGMPSPSLGATKQSASA